MTMRNMGVMFAGLPGAGTTTAAEYCSDEYGGTHVAVGEELRTWAENDGLENPTSDELGEYAAEQRETFGPGFAMHNLAGRWEREGGPEWPVWIDRVCHIDGHDEMARFLNTSELVWIEADFRTRLERIQECGRDDEGDFTGRDLHNRDQRELHDLGIETLVNNGDVDKVVINEGSLEDFYATLDNAVTAAITE